MNREEALQRFIEDELDWASGLDAAEVTVSVAGGLVVLGGRVASLAEKLAAEQAAERGVRCMPGFRQIDNRISVQLRRGHDVGRLAEAFGGPNG